MKFIFMYDIDVVTTGHIITMILKETSLKVMAEVGKKWA